MNFREGTSLLGHVALKCARPLVDDAQVTVRVGTVFAKPNIETNLPADARDCMMPVLGVLGMKVAATLTSRANSPTALLFTFVNIPREGSATGSLLYRFERG